MNLLIPAAGEGRRFADAGYKGPKPFIYIDGVPMLQHVLNHAPQCRRRIVVLKEDVQPCNGIDPGVAFIRVPPVEAARGAVGTILHAAKLLPLCEPVLVLNCDNVIYPHGGWEYWTARAQSMAVCIATWEVDPSDPNREAYSYVEPCGKEPLRVRSVAEKQVLSPYACAGAFYFESAAMLLAACTLELEFGSLVKGEHYLAPAINQLLAREASVYHQPLNDGSLFVRIGTPEDMPAALEALSHVRA
jgi:NDP-sugar pyrophosphorylase family protein